jgi:hypothetical protein
MLQAFSELRHRWENKPIREFTMKRDVSGPRTNVFLFRAFPLSKALRSVAVGQRRTRQRVANSRREADRLAGRQTSSGRCTKNGAALAMEGVGGHNDQKPRAVPRSRLAVLVQVDRDGTRGWGSAVVEHGGPSYGSGADKRSRQYRRRFSYETGPVNFAPPAARHFITFSWRDATSQLGESGVEVPAVEVFTLGRRCLP